MSITLYNKSELTFDTAEGILAKGEFLEFSEELAEKLLNAYPKYLKKAGVSTTESKAKESPKKKTSAKKTSKSKKESK